MTTDWILANPWGIQVRADSLGNPTAGGSWHAGRVNDVLVMQKDALDGAHGAPLVGSETGGLWLIKQPEDPLNPAAAIPLDDLDHPDVNCLCQGPNDPNHVYAGCDSICRM